MASYTLSLFEDVPGGGWRSNTAPRVTAREILRREVARACASGAPRSSVEALYGKPTHRGLQGSDAMEDEVQRAWRAFARGDFLLLVDDRQIQTLEQEVALREDSRVSLIYLVPLMAAQS
jgi:hypothetical protein